MSYSGTRVLVTGAGGFIGSHLVEELVRAGARVTALLHYNARRDRGCLVALPSEITDHIDCTFGDVCDPFLVRRIVSTQAIVFHLAALIGIPYSYQAPQSYVDTNIHGTLNVLEAAREAQVARVVHVSTSEVYGTAQYVPMDERHPVHPQSPYAASKLGGESLAASYFASFGLPVAIVRPFNTFGPRQSQRAVIPSILSQLARRAAILRVGSLSPRRDFTFVKDTVAGLMAIGTADDVVGEVTHLGSSSDISVGELVEVCCEVAGYRPSVEIDKQRERPEQGEVMRLLCDNARAERVVGWRPRISMRDGLEETWKFVAAQPDGTMDQGYVV